MTGTLRGVSNKHCLLSFLSSVGHWLLNSMICGLRKSIRKQKNYKSLNIMVHYFFYRV